jgi:hypothetical protein
MTWTVKFLTENIDKYLDEKRLRAGGVALWQSS